MNLKRIIIFINLIFTFFIFLSSELKIICMNRISILEFCWDSRSKSHDLILCIMERICLNMICLTPFNCIRHNYPSFNPKISHELDDGIRILKEANALRDPCCELLWKFYQLLIEQIEQNWHYPLEDSQCYESLQSCYCALV